MSDDRLSDDLEPDVSALAINVTVPDELRWTDVRLVGAAAIRAGVLWAEHRGLGA